MLLAGATLFASGCGSSEERPEGPDGGGEGGQPVSVAVTYHDDGYQGDWDNGAGAFWSVEDDGASVSGTLGEDVNERWSQVDFHLTRERDGLKGTAQIQGTDGNAAEVRWELLPAADGNLEGRQQTAWLDEETGEVLLFDANPLWEPISMAVARVEPEPEPEPVAVADAGDPEDGGDEPPPIEDDPGAEDDPFEDDPGMEDDPFGDDPGAEDDPFEDDPGAEDDPFEDDPGMEDDPGGEDDPGFDDDPIDEEPTLVDDPEDDVELQVDEEARAAAEAAARREQRQRQLAEASREQRKDPEGLARAIMKAINDGDGRLYTSCWIINADARFLAGAREAELIQIARGQMQDVWGGLTQSHPGIRKGEFVRFEGDVQRGKKTNEVRDGLLVYRLSSGEEKSLNLRLLVEVEDGSWKVQDLEP
jgi:hypothetical protein